MSTFDCSFEEFKRQANEFRLAAPDLNIDELDNAWKCLGLHYLGMNEPMWQGSAVIVLNMMTRVFLDREAELLS